MDTEAFISRYFRFEHLKSEKLREISMPFGVLAGQIAQIDGDHQQIEVALQKLLEAKDAAVRAAL